MDEQKDKALKPYKKWASTHLLTLLNPASNGAIILQRTIHYNNAYSHMYAFCKVGQEGKSPIAMPFIFLKAALVHVIL
jgi:hypothetical protein